MRQNPQRPPSHPGLSLPSNSYRAMPCALIHPRQDAPFALHPFNSYTTTRLQTLLWTRCRHAERRFEVHQHAASSPPAFTRPGARHTICTAPRRVHVSFVSPCRTIPAHYSQMLPNSAVDRPSVQWFQSRRSGRLRRRRPLCLFRHAISTRRRCHAHAHHSLCIVVTLHFAILHYLSQTLHRSSARRAASAQIRQSESRP
jgi:hypothetical protein